jgi:uncharacterized membrane protein YqjE
MTNPVRTLVANATGLAHGRLTLFGIELREELARFRAALLGGFAAILLGVLSVAAAGTAVVIVAEGHRVTAAIGLAVVFACAAAVLVAWVRSALAAKSMAFTASIAALERDREALEESTQTDRAAVAASAGELSRIVGRAGELGRLISIGTFAYTVGRRLRRAS